MYIRILIWLHLLIHHIIIILMPIMLAINKIGTIIIINTSNRLLFIQIIITKINIINIKTIPDINNNNHIISKGLKCKVHQQWIIWWIQTNIRLDYLYFFISDLFHSDILMRLTSKLHYFISVNMFLSGDFLRSTLEV